MAKKKTEYAIVSRVGYTNDSKTVLFVVGDGDVIGVDFKIMGITGEHEWYNPTLYNTLVGKKVEFTYTSVSDMRVPQGVQFVKFVD